MLARDETPIADPVVLLKNMLSVQLSIIKFVCKNPCVVNARFVPWTCISIAMSPPFFELIYFSSEFVNV